MIDDCKALGALFGQGIGDALGIRYEFTGKADITDNTPEVLRYTTSGTLIEFGGGVKQRAECWQPGEYVYRQVKALR